MRTALTILTTVTYASTAGLMSVYAWAAGYGLAAAHGAPVPALAGVAAATVIAVPATHYRRRIVNLVVREQLFLLAKHHTNDADL